MDREQSCVFYLRVGRLIGLRLLCTSCAAACGLLCGGDMLLKKDLREEPGRWLAKTALASAECAVRMPIEANTSSAAQNTFAPINIADADVAFRTISDFDLNAIC